MRISYGVGLFVAGLLVIFAANQDTVQPNPTATRRHRADLVRNARMGFWLPRQTPVNERADLFRVVAPGAYTGAAFQASPSPPVYKFSDSLAIRNPWLPLATLVEDILDGTVGGQTDHIERTLLPGQTKTFMINGQAVQALIVEDKESVAGQLSEITYDYFAQDDNGTVHYPGEEATQYTNGHPSGHSGSWLYGVDTLYIGTIFPGYPKPGQTWEAEHVIKMGIGVEHDRLIAMDATITVPAGTFRNCMETLEITPGEQENKWYCPSIGVVEEFITTTDVVTLTSHQSAYQVP